MSTLPSWVRDSLRCPACRSELRDAVEQGNVVALVCSSASCALRYPVQGGIPVLLTSDATAEPTAS